jgi:hypothetical protein
LAAGIEALVGEGSGKPLASAAASARRQSHLLTWAAQ